MQGIQALAGSQCKALFGLFIEGNHANIAASPPARLEKSYVIIYKIHILHFICKGLWFGVLGFLVAVALEVISQQAYPPVSFRTFTWSLSHSITTLPKAQFGQSFQGPGTIPNANSAPQLRQKRPAVASIYPHTRAAWARRQF